MRKIMFGLLCLTIALAIAACSGVLENSTDEMTILNEDYENALSIQVQLIVGTLRLEGTDFAIDSEQASELITPWQAFRGLGSSDTAAQGEIAAIITQILETMTAEQIESIASMELTREDIFGIAQEMGIALGGALFSDDAPDGDTGSKTQGSKFAGSPPDGGLPGGGIPGGEGRGRAEFGQDLEPEQIATLRAEQGERANFSDRAAFFLINPLIELLEAKAQS
jgi:hypothetical protein